MVILQNRTRRAIDFNLPHESYCGEGPCACSTVEQPVIVNDMDTGVQGLKVVEKKFCASITLLAGGLSDELADSVLNVPDVSAAIARGEVVAVQS